MPWSKKQRKNKLWDRETIITNCGSEISTRSFLFLFFFNRLEANNTRTRFPLRIYDQNADATCLDLLFIWTFVAQGLGKPYRGIKSLFRRVMIWAKQNAKKTEKEKKLEKKIRKKIIYYKRETSSAYDLQLILLSFILSRVSRRVYIHIRSNRQGNLYEKLTISILSRNIWKFGKLSSL